MRDADSVPAPTHPLHPHPPSPIPLPDLENEGMKISHGYMGEALN